MVHINRNPSYRHQTPMGQLVREMTRCQVRSAQHQRCTDILRQRACSSSHKRSRPSRTQRRENEKGPSKMQPPKHWVCIPCDCLTGRFHQGPRPFAASPRNHLRTTTPRLSTAENDASDDIHRHRLSWETNFVPILH
jgi:hypothetical protein